MLSKHWTMTTKTGLGWVRATGSAGDSVEHSHFAAQAILSDKSAIRVDCRNKVIESNAIFIESMVPHRVHPVSDVLIYLVEPGCPVWPKDLVQHWLQRGQTAVVLQHSNSKQLVWSRAHSARANGQHPKIVLALSWIGQHLQEQTLYLSEVAAEVGMPVESFRKKFTQQVGLPFSRYILWRRLDRALATMRVGENATTAAHAAGFNDLSHFHRVLKQMGGITPKHAQFD